MSAAPYRILVTGSRNWTDRQTVLGALLDAVGGRHGPDVVIVHGGAAGVDEIAGEFAATMRTNIEVHEPDWDRCSHGCPPRRHRKGRPNGRTYCPVAGHRRNQLMVDLGADLCLAFIHAGSKGASDCTRRAEGAGIPTKRFTA